MPLSQSFKRLAGLLLLLALAVVSSACGDKSVAQVSNESDAIEIIDVLKEHGFDVSKEEVGEGATRRWSVVVNEGLFGGSDAALAMQVLRDNGLPRPEDKGLEGAYEDQGMFPSESAQHAQRLKELKTEVERQLRMLPGVTRASVTIVLPEDNALNLNPHPATAGVLIVYKDAKPAFTGEQIQNLVAGGVRGLKPQNVNVSMSQQPPRAVPRQDLSIRRRTFIVLTIISIPALILLVLLGIWWMRRRRAEPVEPASLEPSGAIASGEQSEFGKLLEADPRSLAAQGMSEQTGSRRLPGAEEPSPAQPTSERELERGRLLRSAKS
ncbi:MAG TPA: hypothetical protein VGB73_09850 [Pyrinomonadaceae bacterium]|jgi:type III secretion protein J